MKIKIIQQRQKRCIRDRQFGIQGRGGGILCFSNLFFSLFLHNKLFLNKLEQVFSLENNTLKSEKCNQKQHLE